MFKKTGKALGGGLLSAGLVLMMLLASVLPFAKSANAAGTPKITVTAAEDNHDFGAYQILKGTADGKTLTGIQWGDNVTPATLLDALTKNETTKALGFTTSDSAAEFANRLKNVQDKSTTAVEFSKVVKQNLKGDPKGSFDKTGAAPSFTYTNSTVGEAGYYLIRDKETSTAKAFTSPILQVVGEVTIDSKSSVPTSDKEVKENNPAPGEEGWGETADYEIGQEVPFKLTGTMPSNIADFTTYKYGFKDTLSKGFDFNKKSVKVTIDDKTVPAANYTISDATATADTDPYYAGGHDFSVMFTEEGKDLKAAAKAAGATLTASSKVVVEYTATVNSNAVINDKGNGNKSHVVYQKDVNGGKGEPKGETPVDHTWVFTYKLDTTKVDSANTDQKLAGAEFKLLNADKSKAAELVDGKISKWVDVAQGTVIASPAGGLFSIAGLDAGTYYLSETKAPEGYNLPADPNFKFVINAEHKDGTESDPVTDKNLTKLEVTSGTAAAAPGDLATATVKQTITNTSGSDLPKTGGMGTALFTVAGLAVMAAAGGGIAYRRRKANA